MPTSSRKLFTFEFLALNGIIVVAFCNIAVFYSFFHYLGNIGITPAWRGILVGLEPMTAFVLRLFVIPLIGAKDTSRLILVSLVMVIAASWAYPFAVTIPSLLVLRIFHGAAFVLLTSAVIALIVTFIPKEKSGQGFGIISVATMIPYAVVPPITETLLPHVANEATIYAGFSIFAFLAICLLAIMRRRIGKTLADMDADMMRRPALSEIRKNLGNRAVLMLLFLSLLTYLAHATVFYFMKDLSLQNHLGDVGLFFSISMVTMISVRALGGPAFDKIDKTSTLLAGFVFLTVCLILFSRVSGGLSFYCLAGLYGFSMGVILPQINALIFTFSAPGLRGLNTNLGLFAMDMGYFITPALGGAMVGLSRGYATPFDAGAGLALVSLFLVMSLKRMGPPNDHNYL
ncbi:MAG: MFS transporter [Proteobacteria bacterium]|nr:MFS transporter [Pseudomonadota bacterium]